MSKEVHIKKITTYGMYFAGQNFIWFLIGTFMAEFFTDINIPAATVAFILLVVKIWGAVIDPLFGALIDKMPFKSGKFIPWIKLSVFLVPSCTIFMFAIPDSISLEQKIFWALLSNIIWDTAYTMCDAPAYGLITSLSRSIKERNFLLITNRIFGYTASAVATGFIPTLKEWTNDWLSSIIYVSIISFIFMFPVAFFNKEVKQPATKKEKLTIKQILFYIKHNKYMVIFYIGTFIEEGLAVNGVLNVYFAKHCLGDEKLLGILSILNTIFIIFVGFLTPVLLKKYEKYSIFMLGIVSTCLLSFIQYFAGYNNWTLFLFIWTIKAFTLSFVKILTYSFTPDFAEYGIWKTNIPATGVTFTLQTFCSKLNGALSAALGAYILALIKFKEGKDAVQLPSFNGNLWFVYTIIPAVGFLISIFVFHLYKLRDKDIEKFIKEKK